MLRMEPVIYHLQAFSVIFWLCGHVERVPPIRLLERDDSDVLLVHQRRARAHRERRGRVGVVHVEAEVYAEFLDGDLPRELDGDEVRLGAVGADASAN